jgi:hypothetical protein
VPERFAHQRRLLLGGGGAIVEAGGALQLLELPSSDREAPGKRGLLLEGAQSGPERTLERGLLLHP